MRVSDIVGMTEYLLRRGAVLTALAAALWAVGYFVIYRKICRGSRRIQFRTAAAGAVFLCYLMVVCGATLERGAGYRGVQLVPFASYREAWCVFSAAAWRNIILNICMFVPFGFLLPCLSKRFQVFWRTYLAGGAFALLIELVQLVFHLGIFETDDIINNVLGAAIGYGGYYLLRLLLSRFLSGRRERGSLAAAAALQIPLCLTAAVFGAIFLTYHYQELGNLRSDFYSRVSMKGVEVRLEIQLSQERAEAQIYRLHVADREETGRAAEAFLAGLGAQVDSSRTDLYDKTAIYYSDGGRYNLWIDYVGCKMNIHDSEAGWAEGESVPGREDADREEVLAALFGMGIAVPEEAEFENVGKGNYRFTVRQFMEDGVMRDGALSCRYHVNGRLSDVDNGIIAFGPYREGAVKAEQEAYEEILAGRFRWTMDGERLREVVIRDVELGYEVDSKGFYQPVYLFDVLCNQRETEIVIPAL